MVIEVMVDLPERPHHISSGSSNRACDHSSPCIRNRDAYRVFTSVIPTLQAALVAHTMARAFEASGPFVLFVDEEQHGA